MEQTANKDEKAKHTPGDWSVLPEKLNDGQHIAGRCSEVVCGKTLIARVNRFGQEPSDPIGDANARMISAAPDMLEACKTAQEICWDAEQGAYDRKSAKAAYAKVTAAIAKATGGVA